MFYLVLNFCCFGKTLSSPSPSVDTPPHLLPFLSSPGLRPPWSSSCWRWSPPCPPWRQCEAVEVEGRRGSCQSHILPQLEQRQGAVLMAIVRTPAPSTSSPLQSLCPLLSWFAGLDFCSGAPPPPGSSSSPLCQSRSSQSGGTRTAFSVGTLSQVSGWLDFQEGDA